jgi:hypothetical protein
VAGSLYHSDRGGRAYQGGHALGVLPVGRVELTCDQQHRQGSFPKLPEA